MCLHKSSQRQKYLVALESNVNKMNVKVYSWNKKEGIRCQSKCGATIAHFDSIIYKAHHTDNHIYITLVENKVLKFSFDELIAKFKVYINYPDEKWADVNKTVHTLSKKDVSNSSSEMTWFCVVSEINGKLITGDWKGNMFEYRDNDFLHTKSCHSSRITEVIGFSTQFNSRVMTASQDGTIKVWSEEQSQLGQYNSTSGISVVCHVVKKDGYNDFVYGDQMGYLNILRWHDQD